MQASELKLAILPILILLGGALLMWLTRRRPARLSWAIAAVAAFSAWLSSMLLARAVPLQASISVWRPLDLFAAQIELRFDVINARPIIAGTTVLLTVILSTVLRLADREFRFGAIGLVYCALALIAMQSANLLTIALSWAMIDLVTLISGLNGAKDDASISSLLARVTVDASGILAVIGAAIASGAAGGMDDLAIPLVNKWATALLVLAVVLRLGLARLDYSLAGLPGVDDATATLRSFLSPAAALVILARQFAFGIPPEIENWLRVGSAIGLLICGARWVIEDETKDRQRFLTFGMAFLGIMASTVVPARFEAPLLSAILVMLVVGTLSSIFRVHTPWHRVFPALAVWIMAMPVWGAGALLVQGISYAMGLGINLWVAIVGSIGLAMLAAGILRDVFKKVEAWYVDDLARLLYAAALILPVGVGLAVGGGAELAGGARAIVVTLLTIGGAVGIVSLIRRVDRVTWQRARGVVDRLHMGSVLNAAEGSLRWVSSSLRGIGGILEGEGAMLWVFVIILLVQLVIAGASQ